MTDAYDRQGRPIDIGEFAKLHQDFDYKVVKKTQVDDAEVSTVWLGLDHGLGEGEPPLIFETMIFGGENDQFTDRYSTEADALAGHERVVAALNGHGPLWEDEDA